MSLVKVESTREEESVRESCGWRRETNLFNLILRVRDGMVRLSTQRSKSKGIV